MEKDRNNMVSEPSIPVVACTEMTTSAAEEERCRELLAKLKDAIDKRGVMLDRLGKVMDEMVSSLASSTPLLVSSAADSTPNSTATNKVPAMTNAATSANATLTDQAHTKCSRLGLDTNADNLHVVAASNPETGVPTIASAPAEHSSAPSLKPFSTTQQDTLMPTMYSTICPDRSINVPTSVRATAVPPTSSSIIAALEIDNTLIDSTKLATAAASSTAVAFPQLITITEVIESSTRSTLAAFVSAHKLEVAATTSFITMCSTRQDDMCWLLRDDPSSEPDAVHLPVTILQSGLYICSLSCRAMQGHIRYHELPALGMCFVEPQQPWPPPTRVVCGMIMKFGLCKFNEKAIDRVVLNGVPLLILGLGKIEEFLGTVVRLQPWPPPAGPNCRDLLVKVDKVLGHMVDITLRWVVLQPPWPPPNLTAQIKMSYPAPLQIVEMKPWPPPRRGSCLLFSSITGTQDEFGAVLKHHLDNLLVVQNSSNQHEWRLPQLLLVYLVMVLNNCNASCRESNHGNFLQGNAVEVWEAHKVAVQTVLKLPSGELFTGSSDSTIKLWKGRTCLHIFSGHANTIRCVAQMPGYGAALTKVTINKEIPFELHQLAAVLLKQFIKQHWQEDEENFMPPIVSASEKVVIRQLLLTSLDDSHGKIHTAIGMAVAAIGQQDWPEDWPKLLPFLLKLIGDQSNGNGVHGALRCLALLSDDLDDTCIPKLVPELFPSLYRIMSSPHLFENSLRAKAIGIVHSCISMLGSMSGVYKRETVSLMTSMLDPLTEQFSIILNSLVQSQNPDDWSMQMEVLKCLLQLVQNFSRLPEAKLSAVLAPLWQTFVSSFNVYHLSTIQASEDVDSVGYDSDGSERSIESFGIQLFELWTTIVGNSRLAKVITGNIKELAYYTIAFQQITQEQVQNWSRDANQYVADEDDVTYSCRVSGSLLLEEIVTAYEDYGIDSILEASQMRFRESRELKQAGSADWWRLHEASLFALGSLSEQLCEAQDSGYNVRDLLEQLVIDIVGTGVHQYPFLHARAFSIVAKFSSVINKGICEQYLCNAAHAISSDVPSPVKVGACRALAQLLPESNEGLIQPNIMGILSSLIDLLRQASDETLHLVLETLQSAIKSGGEQSVLIEPVISPIILDVWAQHIADPFISIDAVEVLEAIKNAPGCLQPLVCRILPTIGSILGKPKIQPDGLVAGSLDLLTMILKNAPTVVVKAIFDTCFTSTIQIILESDDHGEMQNATECLSAFISDGRQDLLVWGGEQGRTLKMLLDTASRLLDPVLESSVSLFVGSYILQLILHLPSHLSPHIPELIAAIVRRMQSSSIAGLKSSLVVIIARLVHLSAPNIDQFINLLLAIPAQGYDNSFAYIMSEWSQLQGEIQGAYQIKVTTTALALLISTRHPELSRIEVQGHLIKTSAGITTRSKARVAPDHWTKIPLPAKIFSLLADTLAEIQEQVGGDGDDDCEEDSDWEEVQNGDAIPHDMVYSASVPSNANPSVEHLNAMAKVFDEDDDDIDDDDLAKTDSLNEVKLSDFLTNIFVNLWESDRPLFEYLCQSLSDSQRAAVENVLRK